jgi:hypothetical protein
MTIDKFGISYIFPTRTGGREYFSIWETGPKRDYVSGQSSEYDSREHYTGNQGAFTIYGESGTDDLGEVRTGQLNMHRGVGNTPRLYNRTNISSGYTDDLGLEEWRSFEATLYSYLPYSSNPSDYGESYSGMTIGGFSNHIPDKFDPYYYGDYTSRAYYANFTWDGRAVNRKEIRFPTTIIFPNSNRPFTDGGNMPTSQWIGMKFVCRAYSNVRKVKMETYLDMTEGLDGGTWYKVLENVDYDGYTSYKARLGDRTWYANLTSSTDADYSINSTSLSPTVIGVDAPTIVDSKMRVIPETEIYWTYSSGVDAGQTGSIRFKYTPHYEGAPDSAIQLIKIANLGNDYNKLYLVHNTDGNLKLYMYDLTGTLIYNGEILDEWLPHYDTTYYFDLCWNNDRLKNLFEVRVYIDTIQIGTSLSSEFLRVSIAAPITTTTIGCAIPAGGTDQASWSAISFYPIDIHNPDPMPAGQGTDDVPIDTAGQFWHGKIIDPDYYSRCFSVFFRNDNVKVQYYKYWSIREVDTLYEYPLPESQLNVNNSLEGCTIM